MSEEPSVKRMAPPPLFLLVAITAIQPLALNLIAPSTPALVQAFATDYATVQLTLTVFLIAVAVSQLITGPWSDRAGRRPIVLFALAAFIVGCVAAAVAPTIEALIAARAVQAVGSGTAFVLARSIIRDTSERDEAASRIGYMMVAMLVVPMLSPTIGSLIDQAAGWRMIFVAMGAVAAGSLLLVWRLMPETHVTRDPTASLGKLASAFPILLRSPAFLAYTLSTCATSGMFFAFVAGAPHVVVETMKSAPYVYGLWFIVMSTGYATGNFVSGRFAARLGSDRLIVIGSWISLAATVVQAAAAFIEPWTPAALFLPNFALALGNGMTIPGATAAALSVRPNLAGAASGLAGAAQLGSGAAMSYLAGHVVTTAPRGLVAIMLGCAIVGVLALAIPRNPPNFQAPR